MHFIYDMVYDWMGWVKFDVAAGHLDPLELAPPRVWLGLGGLRRMGAKQKGKTMEMLS